MVWMFSVGRELDRVTINPLKRKSYKKVLVAPENASREPHMKEEGEGGGGGEREEK